MLTIKVQLFLAPTNSFIPCVSWCFLESHVWLVILRNSPNCGCRSCYKTPTFCLEWILCKNHHSLLGGCFSCQKTPEFYLGWFLCEESPNFFCVDDFLVRKLPSLSWLYSLLGITFLFDWTFFFLENSRSLCRIFLVRNLQNFWILLYSKVSFVNLHFKYPLSVFSPTILSSPTSFYPHCCFLWDIATLSSFIPHRPVFHYSSIIKHSARVHLYYHIHSKSK